MKCCKCNDEHDTVDGLCPSDVMKILYEDEKNGGDSKTQVAAGQLPPDVEKAYEDKANILKERYVILAVLGSGGMGSVYRGYDLRLKRYVAVKFMHFQSDESLERFKREATTLAQLNHPNIAQIYDFDKTEDGRYFICMQLVEGKAMQHGKIDVLEAVQVARDVAKAMEYAHAHGILHRDIKPSNIMKGSDGRTYVMDFGLARYKESSQRITKSDEVIGSPAYMSPEHVLGQKVDERTDIYSLGATLYELLAGKPPFEGTTTAETIAKILHNEPAPVASLNPSVAEPLEGIIMKCLSKNRDERYASASALVTDLEAFLSGDVEAIRVRIAKAGGKVCLKCKTSAPSDAVYCPVCGTALVARIACCHCGQMVPPGASYCSYCGKRVLAANRFEFDLIYFILIIANYLSLSYLMLVAMVRALTGSWDWFLTAPVLSTIIKGRHLDADKTVIIFGFVWIVWILTRWGANRIKSLVLQEKDTAGQFSAALLLIAAASLGYYWASHGYADTHAGMISIAYVISGILTILIDVKPRMTISRQEIPEPPGVPQTLKREKANNMVMIMIGVIVVTAIASGEFARLAWAIVALVTIILIFAPKTVEKVMDHVKSRDDKK